MFDTTMLTLAGLKSMVKRDPKLRILISGPSGFGKTYMSQELNAIDLDDFCSVEGDDWICDRRSFERSYKQNRIFCGTCDNLSVLARDYKWDAKIVILPTSNVSSYRRIMRKKAQDNIGIVPSTWTDHWIDLSRMTVPQIRAYVLASISDYVDTINADFLISNRFVQLPDLENSGRSLNAIDVTEIDYHPETNEVMRGPTFGTLPHHMVMLDGGGSVDAALSMLVRFKTKPGVYSMSLIKPMSCGCFFIGVDPRYLDFDLFGEPITHPISMPAFTLDICSTLISMNVHKDGSLRHIIQNILFSVSPEVDSDTWWTFDSKKNLPAVEIRELIVIAYELAMSDGGKLAISAPLQLKIVNQFFADHYVGPIRSGLLLSRGR